MASIFDKGVKVIQNIALPTKDAGVTGYSYGKKMNLNPYLTVYIKIKLK